MRHLRRPDLERLLPHRGQNLFIDAVEVSADGLTARSRTSLAGRPGIDLDLFTRADPQWDAVWYEPMIAELLALTGAPLVTTDAIGGDRAAVFSVISRLRTGRMPPPTAMVVAQTSVVRRRENATFLRARAEVDGACVLEAEVVATVAGLAALTARRACPLSDAGADARHVEGLAWKDRRIGFVDGVRAIDEARSTLTTVSTYPPTHAFAAGHFPGAPVMMGVAQWAAIADAAWLARLRFLPEARAVRAQATIRRADGVVVADARDVVVLDDGGIPRIGETGRIVFRDAVIPGDGLEIVVRIAAVDA